MGEAVRRRDGSGAIDRLRRAVAEEVVIGGGQGSEVGCSLLIAPLRIGPAAIDRKADHPDHREHREDEDDEDLAFPRTAGRGRGAHRGPLAHWILALLAVVKVIGPNGARSGRIGWDDVRTETLTQSRDWHVPETLAPARSMQSYEVTVRPGTSARSPDTELVVSVLLPRVAVPGWTLVTRAISRAASDTPLKRNAARARSTSPMRIARKTVIPRANSTRLWPRDGRLRTPARNRTRVTA